MGGLDARFSKPTTLLRSGTYVFTYVDFYGVTTTAYTEIRAYNSAGVMLSYPFTDPDSVQVFTSSGVVVYPTGLVPRQYGTIWNFKNATLSSQAVSFHLLLWAEGTIIDYW